jgi:transcriptional/translational regulatory protein YebC/TACO1
VKCGKTLGRGSDAWIFALDAMVNVGKNKNADDQALKAELDKAAQAWLQVQKVKQDETRLTSFESWTGKLEQAFAAYKTASAYQKITDIIEENVEQNMDALVFHESNSCPEFWENTRLATGLNVAELLLKSALSLIE